MIFIILAAVVIAVSVIEILPFIAYAVFHYGVANAALVVVAICCLALAGVLFFRRVFDD